MSERRWQYEPFKDQFEEVGADEMKVNSGALEFYSRGRIHLVIAPGQWLSAFLDED